MDLKVSFNQALTANSKLQKFTGYRVRMAAPVLISLVQGDTEQELLGIFPVFQYGFLETLPANLDTFEIWKWGYLY